MSGSTPSPPESGIHSRMLHSSADAKVVHFAFAAGEELSEHTASRPATVQIISGRFELTLAGERVAFEKANTYSG